MEKKQVLVSIVIPVRNVERYLRRCLDSILNQSLYDIELICVEDCSDDASSVILREYEKKDPRVTVIYHKENMGTSKTRKDGVDVTCGKYVMFVDSDDELTPDACEIAFQAIENGNADFVHFGVECINDGGVLSRKIKGVERFCAPCTEEIYEKNLISACWKEHKFGFNLWNKIYNGDICRKAFAMVEDIHCSMAEDLYVFFIIAYFSKCCTGIEKKLYRHYYGIGIVGNDFISLDKFEAHLSQIRVWEALDRFVHDLPEKEELQDVLDGIKRHFMKFCIEKWKNNLVSEFWLEGFQRLVDVFGCGSVVAEIAEKNWLKADEIAQKLVGADFLRHSRRNGKRPLTIAAYYRSLKNGGAERILAGTCNLWAGLTDENEEPLFRVICINDENADTQNDIEEYDLNPAVKREFLPGGSSYKPENYIKRYEKWNEIISKYKIDIVVSSGWADSFTFWDMLSVKSHHSKPAFMIHSHNYCAVPYMGMGRKSVELIFDYQLCDGVVVLSQADKKYVECFCDNVHYIVNPMTFSVENTALSEYEEHSLLWLARFSPEKRPLDVVAMMKYVIKEVPDARLYMVGTGDEVYCTEVKELIKDFGLEHNIILAGFQKDVEKFYKRASVFVGTSEYEGFPTTYGEAMAHGIPVVAYEIPWLTYDRAGKGIVTVAQKRVDFLAKEVIALLNNQEKVKQLGMEGRHLVEELGKIDIGAQWKSFFDGAGGNKKSDCKQQNERFLFEQIVFCLRKGKEACKDKLHQVYVEKSETNRKLHRTYAEKSEINRKLQITYKEKADRGMQIREITDVLKKERRNNMELNVEISRLRKELDRKTVKGIIKRVLKKFKSIVKRNFK